MPRFCVAANFARQPLLTGNGIRIRFSVLLPLE
jgi:hypothetical protein